MNTTAFFGKNTAWAVPYEPGFVRSEKHASILYCGASLKALQLPAEEKGYTFIGSNSKGNNAYFIRNCKSGNLKVKSVEEGYVASKFRETVVQGERVAGTDRIKLIEGLDAMDVQSGQTLKIDASLVRYQEGCLKAFGFRCVRKL